MAELKSFAEFLFKKIVLVPQLGSLPVQGVKGYASLVPDGHILGGREQGSIRHIIGKEG